MTFVFLLLVGLPVLWHFATIKYVNRYTLTFVFGRKGSGKTSTIAKYASKYRKKGVRVYSNVPMPDCYLICDDDIGRYHFEPGSVILIDEVGMIWDCRNFKGPSKLPEHVRDFFKLQRHYKLTVFLFSQVFDVDKKIRDLCDVMYQIRCVGRVFSVGRRIRKHQVIVKAAPEAPARIDDDLKVESGLLSLLRLRRYTFLPKYVKMFDSWSAPELLPKRFALVGYDQFPGLKPPKKKKNKNTTPKIML